MRRGVQADGERSVMPKGEQHHHKLTVQENQHVHHRGWTEQPKRIPFHFAQGQEFCGHLFFLNHVCFSYWIE